MKINIKDESKSQTVYVRGSAEHKKHMQEIARLPRPNSKGGAFRDKDLAAKAGRIGGLKGKKL